MVTCPIQRSDKWQIPCKGRSSFFQANRQPIDDYLNGPGPLTDLLIISANMAHSLPFSVVVGLPFSFLCCFFFPAFYLFFAQTPISSSLFHFRSFRLSSHGAILVEDATRYQDNYSVYRGQKLLSSRVHQRLSSLPVTHTVLNR